MRVAPRFDPAQIRPRESSKSAPTWARSMPPTERVSNRVPRMWTRPLTVPIQSEPSRAASSACTQSSESAGVLRVSKIVNRTPSNRTRPSCVPSQRYPSLVCAMAVTEFCGRPESLVHASCPYCDSGIAGSMPAAAPAESARASAVEQKRGPRTGTNPEDPIRVRTSTVPGRTPRFGGRSTGGQV